MNVAKIIRIPGFCQRPISYIRTCSVQSQELVSTTDDSCAASLRVLTRARGDSVPVRIEDQRSLKAAIIGLPNVGKSTLVNHLIGQKIFAVSPKRHTTLHRAMGVFTEGASQVVLLDTPGLIPYREGRKLKVTKQFLTDPARSTMEADIIVVMMDAANKHNRSKIDPQIISLLMENHHLPSILVLNKVDLLKHKHVLLSLTEGLTASMESKNKHTQISDLKKKLREQNLPEKIQIKFQSLIKELQAEIDSEEKSFPGEKLVENESRFHIPSTWTHFKEIFMISSLTGDGVGSLKNYLLSQAVPSEWQYSSCDITDTPTLELVEDIVREKLFKYLEKEIPYVLTQDNVLWEKSEDGALTIYQNINCKTDKQTSIVIGPAGRTIQAITTEAEADMKKLLDNGDLDLTLNVRTHQKR